MECPAYRDVLSAELDGEDGEEDGVGVAAARRHAAGCAECGRWLVTVRKLRGLAAKGAEPDPEAAAAVLRALRGRAPGI